MPPFKTRVHAEEMMDDFSITDVRLTRALDDLRFVNRFLGGYRTTISALRPWLLGQRGRRVRLLDLGTGVADIPEYLVRWADRRGIRVEVVALDANPATVAYAAEVLDGRLPPALRERVRVETGDALRLPYERGAFDVVLAAMFMHHLDHEAAVALLREMHRVGREGLVVNDLHRHPLAYYGIRALAPLVSPSPMFRHDGPLSVLRGFTRAELDEIARAAGLVRYRIRWHWAFRWSLSSV